MQKTSRGVQITHEGRVLLFLLNLVSSPAQFQCGWPLSCLVATVDPGPIYPFGNTLLYFPLQKAILTAHFQNAIPYYYYYFLLLSWLLSCMSSSCLLCHQLFLSTDLALWKFSRPGVALPLSLPAGSLACNSEYASDIFQPHLKTLLSSLRHCHSQMISRLTCKWKGEKLSIHRQRRKMDFYQSTLRSLDIHFSLQSMFMIFKTSFEADLSSHHFVSL